MPKPVPITFQSPQWGDNSKASEENPVRIKSAEFQSPQWGDNSKVTDIHLEESTRKFQSPQWGDNSKGHPLETA